MKGPLSFKNLINDNQENKEGIIDNVRNCFHLYSVKYYFLYKGTIFLNYKSVMFGNFNHKLISKL